MHVITRHRTGWEVCSRGKSRSFQAYNDNEARGDDHTSADYYRPKCCGSNPSTTFETNIQSLGFRFSALLVHLTSCHFTFRTATTCLSVLSIRTDHPSTVRYCHQHLHYCIEQLDDINQRKKCKVYLPICLAVAWATFCQVALTSIDKQWRHYTECFTGHIHWGNGGASYLPVPRIKPDHEVSFPVLSLWCNLSLSLWIGSILSTASTSGDGHFALRGLTIVLFGTITIHIFLFIIYCCWNLECHYPRLARGN